MAERDRIVLKGIEEEMKTAYIDYSMSVIVSRALPDVRDGLKPVHRRVLYGMSQLGLASNRPYKKSARIVGEVLGKYHPHGDTAVYESLVRMAQEWSLRYPLVDGQGNFGSIDGDSPAAMRYTEARLRKVAEELLTDLDKNTVDFRPNFDDSDSEPSVLPGRIPNLLVNGASGIAVGMATNMAPHNLTEVCNGIIAYIENRQITIDELIEKHITAPDFPTGGIIYGYEGVKEAFHTGRGRVVMRAVAEIEEHNGRERIIVTEIPYQVNKALMLEKIAQSMNEKKIEGISDFNDESDRDGLRIVFEIKRDAMANVVLNQLYKHSALQTSFGINNVALVNGRPVTLNVKDLIRHYVDHRHEVVIRRTQYELEEAEKRAHILEGLIIALDHLDEVITLIRTSRTPDQAREGLIGQFGLSEIQAKAILDMRLQRLTGLEMDKIREEYQELLKKIEGYREILSNEELRMSIIKGELAELKEKYGDGRRTKIEFSGEDFSMEDMIADEEVVITISHAGYIKRTPLSEYKRQSRGGIGAKGAGTKEDDFVEHLFTATNHNYLMFFTEMGRCFWLRVYEIPEGNKSTKGRAIQNLIQIPKEDKVKAFINVTSLSDPEVLSNHSIIMVTRKGTIKKTALEAYSRPRQNGIHAIHIVEGDELVEAKLTDGKSEILIGIKSGRAIRFPETKVRDMGRTATGVRAVTLEDENDAVIGMIIIQDPVNTNVLVVSETGYGKRSAVEDYRITNRGGKGVKTIQITPKTGALIAVREVSDTDDLMIMTRKGTTIRMAISEIREAGRNTQGVRLIKLREDDSIASITRLAEREEEPGSENDEISPADSSGVAVE
jgi:DNA gyrase subunit A